MTRPTRALAVLLCAAISLAACSGGANTASGMIPGATAPASHHRTGFVKAVLHIPPRKKQSARAIAYMKAQLSKHSHHGVHPKYLSGATTELDFVINTNNGQPATPADQAAFDFSIYTSNSSVCTGDAVTGYTCTTTQPAPAGSDTYQVFAKQCSVNGSGPSSSCSSLGGTLTLLSASYVTMNVPFDGTVVAAFTLSPVVASIDWAPVTYANLAGSGSLPTSQWLTQPDGSSIPSYNPNTSPGTYTCPGTNDCYEPAAANVNIAWGEVLEARDASGALIVGASDGGQVYQTPLYLDSNGNAITISWSCTDQANGTTAQIRSARRSVRPDTPKGTPPPAAPSLTWETGGGPYNPSSSAPAANQAFNSPVADPLQDADGGNTTDANGNPVTAVGNNGTEMNWDGQDEPLLNSPDYCTAQTSNGLTTASNFYVGLGEGGIYTGPTPPPSPAPDANIYEMNSIVSQDGTNYDPTQDIVGFTSGFENIPSFSPVAIGGLPGPTTQTSSRAGAMTFDSAGDLWIGETTQDSANPGVVANYIVEYGPNPTANSLPIKMIQANSNSMIGGIAVDGSGNVYVSDASAIDVYASNAAGSSTAIRTISGPATGIGTDGRLTFDPNGNLWLANFSTPGQPYAALLEFPPNASGNVAPTAYLDESWVANCGWFNGTNWNPQGISPQGIAFDPQGNLYFMTQFAQQTGTGGWTYETKISILAAGFTQSSCVRNFYAQQTASDLAVDDNGYIYLSGGPGLSVWSQSHLNGGPGGVDNFAPTEFWNTAPLNTPLAIAIWMPNGTGSGDARHRPHARKH